MRLIDVLVHDKVLSDEFSFRVPERGDGDLRFGSQLIVQESQAAIFVRNGQALDVFSAGRHTLSVANLPLLTNLLQLATSGRTPFQAQVYFINLKAMPQVRWGTSTPIPVMLPKTAMGAALLTTFGTMTLQVSDPMRFLKKFAVGVQTMRLDDLKETIQTKLVGELTVLLSNAGIESIPAANGLLNELEGAALAKLSVQFEDELGLRITAFDANPFQAKPVAVDDMMSYMTSETYERIIRVQALRDAAQNSGAGGALAGAGVGFGVGQQMGAMFQSPEQQQQQQMQAMMNQMMMQKMMEMMGGQGQQQPAQATTPAPASGGLQTLADVKAAIESLDMRLIGGEITQEAYDRIYPRLEAKLKELGG